MFQRFCKPSSSNLYKSFASVQRSAFLRKRVHFVAVHL